MEIDPQGIFEVQESSPQTQPWQIESNDTGLDKPSPCAVSGAHDYYSLYILPMIISQLCIILNDIPAIRQLGIVFDTPFLRMAKVLVVDDDVDILSVVKILLSSQGYKVHTLYNGEHTFELAKTFQPDIILLDVGLAGHDGREICKGLKGDATIKDIPVILFSAMPGIKETLSKYDAADFIAKPFDVYDLVETIKKHLKAA